MDAWLNVKLLIGITIGLFLYAFLQPIFLPTQLSNQTHVNILALGFGIISVLWDIRQYRRVRNHYKHLEFNTTDPKCKDCIDKQSLEKVE